MTGRRAGHRSPGGEGRGDLALPRLQILATAILFSTGGAAIKATALSSWQVAGFRSGIAALAVALMVPAARRRWTWRTVVVGSAYAATMILYVTANKLTTAANTIFLQSTAPLYVLFLAPWLLGEPLRRRDLAFMAALASGLVLFFVEIDPPVATAPDPLRGNVMAVLAGVGWAVTVVGLRWMGREEERSAGAGAASVVAGNLAAFVFCLPLALPAAAVSPLDLGVVAYLGIFQIGLAYVLLTRGIRRILALEASLLLLFEPVLNPVWAWVLHGERPGVWALAGGAVILLSTFVKALADRPRRGLP